MKFRLKSNKKYSNLEAFLGLILIIGLILPSFSFAEDIVLPIESPLDTGTSTAEIVIEIIEEIPETLATTTEEIVVEPPTLKEEIFENTSQEIIVKFKESAIDLENKNDRREAKIILNEENLVVEEIVSDSNLSLVNTIGNTDSVDEIINSLEQNPQIEYAEPNYPRTIENIGTNDAEGVNQWALENTGQIVNASSGKVNADINASSAWNTSEGEKAEIIVAVIDTGVNYTHPDLDGSMWDGTNCKDENGNMLGSCIFGYDFKDNDKDPMPDASSTSAFHGTHIAGIIAAEKNNEIGIAGVAPRSKIMALRFASNVLSEIKAIDFARQNGAKIINASYGGTQYSQAEFDAIKRFTDAGGIFIAAATNTINSDSDPEYDNDIRLRYPAGYEIDNIVSVAATDQNDNLAFYSNYGKNSVDLGAPGSNIISTWKDGTYMYSSGTSMAVPHVSAVAALLYGYNPNIKAGEIKEILLESGTSLTDLENKTVSGKRLDALNALLVFKPIITSLSFSTSTNGIADFSFGIIDGFGGLDIKLKQFEYSTDNGLTWITPISGDESQSLLGDWKSAIKTSTATSSYTLSWNTESLDLEEREVISATTSQIKIRFAFSDGATTSPLAISDTFKINTDLPTIEVITEPISTNTGGGGGGGGGSPRPSATAKKGDVNKDGKVDILDFNSVMIQWARQGSLTADFNKDNKVDILDFNTLMINWIK